MATEIGIDLGTSKTVIFSSSKVVLELPSVVTVDAESWEPVYFGEQAKQTIGRTPESFITVFPIEHGVISDYNIAEAMLKNYMQNAFGNRTCRNLQSRTKSAATANADYTDYSACADTASDLHTHLACRRKEGACSGFCAACTAGRRFTTCFGARNRTRCRSSF